MVILSECGRLFELQPKDVAFGFGCVHLYIIMYLDVQKINEVDGEMEWVSDLRSAMTDDWPLRVQTRHEPNFVDLCTAKLRYFSISMN